MATKKDKAKELKNKELHAFYKVTPGDYGNIKDLTIDRLDLLKILRKNGFLRYDINPATGAYIFIQVNKKIVNEVSVTYIRDFWFNYLDKLEPYTHKFYGKTEQDGEPTKVTVYKEDLINKFLGSIGNYLSEQILDRLIAEEGEEIEFLKDTKTQKFIYYKNGFVTISKQGVKFTKDYNQLSGYIWQEQILNRNYNEKLTYTESLKSYFYQFMYNIAGKNPQRVTALQTIVGYLLHDYRDYKLKAPILTDAFLGVDGEANGRTGKGVFSMGLKYMSNDFASETAKCYVSLNGKNFDLKDKHRYADCSINTTCVHIEDIKAYTNIEDFFNDITEGVIVDKKNEKPYRIFPKIIFSTNKTIKIEGGSAKDRTIMYEFAEHYDSNYSPQDEFKHWFFKEWNAEQWQLFDCMMCYSIAEFFKAGKIIEAETINLTRRVLLEHTSREFVTFLDYYMFNDADHLNKLPKGYHLTDGELKKEHEKKQLYDQFTESYPDYTRRRGFNQARFTKWLKLYADNSEILEPITELDERRSNGKDYITFKLKKAE